MYARCERSTRNEWKQRTQTSTKIPIAATATLTKKKNNNNGEEKRNNKSKHCGKCFDTVYFALVLARCYAKTRCDRSFSWEWTWTCMSRLCCVPLDVCALLCVNTHTVYAFSSARGREEMVCMCGRTDPSRSSRQATDQAIMIYIVYLVFVYTLTHSGAYVRFKKKKNAHENRMWKMRRFETFKYAVFSERQRTTNEIACTCDRDVIACKMLEVLTDSDNNWFTCGGGVDSVVYIQ